MSDERKEKISAMIDGELGRDTQSAIDDLLQTPFLKDSWTRYHLISDSLQQQLPEAIDSDLAARVSSSIENEPFILVPEVASKNAFLKPLAGFAIAASVATMAILGIQQSEERTTVQEQQVVSFTPQNAVNTNVAQHVSLARPTEAQLRQVKANARARLNSYLVNYNEYRTNSGLQGMLPYAKTVTFENNQVSPVIGK